MFSKNKDFKKAQASFVSAFALVLMLSSFTTVSAAELSDNDPNIIMICNCVENQETAQSANCQKLFAEMFPEQQKQHARVPASSHTSIPPAQTTGGR
ncbi:hypothetical protein GW916_01580 [bacterium]|nr:hypothetical protein [bacterium]